MAIASTRMHRSLTYFVSGSTNMYDVSNPLTFSYSLRSIQFRTQGDPVQNRSPPDQGAQRIKAVSIPMDGMEVVVHTVSEHHGTLRAREDDSYISTDEQMRGIPDGLRCDHESLGCAV